MPTFIKQFCCYQKQNIPVQVLTPDLIYWNYNEIKYIYAQFGGPLMATQNALNTTKIWVKCDWAENVSLLD
jgi:hypothetical protein